MVPNIGPIDRAPLVILAITDRYPPSELEEEIFSAAQNPRAFRFLHCSLSIERSITTLPLELTSQVDGILLLRHYFGHEELVRFPKLKCLVRTGVGYDRVNRRALSDAGVTLHNVPDYGTSEVADHTLALALSLRRGIILQHDAQRLPNPGWSPVDLPDTPPAALDDRPRLIQRCKDRTWVIVGLGRIGTAVALRAKAFGFRVVFYDPHVSNGMDRALDIDRAQTMETALSQADIVSLHCPHSPSTRHIIDATSLRAIKFGAVLINTARGELIDLEALYDALRSGHLAAVGLDVVEVEPPVDPLPRLLQAYREREGWLLGRLVVTPHSAFYSKESVEDMRYKSAITMRDVLFDCMMTNLVDGSDR